MSSRGRRGRQRGGGKVRLRPPSDLQGGEGSAGLGGEHRAGHSSLRQLHSFCLLLSRAHLPAPKGLSPCRLWSPSEREGRKGREGKGAERSRVDTTRFRELERWLIIDSSSMSGVGPCTCISWFARCAQIPAPRVLMPVSRNAAPTSTLHTPREEEGEDEVLV